MRLRLLLADPAAARRREYEQFFGSAGFDVATAGDGLECLQKLQTHGAEILVLDDTLTWGGAEGVLDRIYGDPNVPWVPVTMAVGQRTPEELAASLDLPPQWCLQKPFPMSTLLDRIHTTVASAAFPTLGPDVHP